MIFLLCLLPILVAIVLMLFIKGCNREEITVIFAVAFVTFFVVMIYSACHVSMVKRGLTQDKEWWGNYSSSIHYYDDWDERVSCRHPIYCTKTVSYECGDGKTSRTCYTTETYVCGYEHPYDVDYHAEYWAIRYDNGREDRISATEYGRLLYLWGNKPYKVELNRHYHSNDGDDVAADWDLDLEHARNVITEHEYTNKVQASNSVFRADKVDSTDVVQYKLYEYPKFTGDAQSVVLGPVIVDSKTKILLSNINGYYGSKKQFKLIICVWRNQSEITAERQHSYWENLNKNEFLVCIGVDNANQIQWCKTYSWMDKPLLGVKVERYFTEHKSLHLYEFGKWLPKNVEEYWDRKHFKDFNYLQVNISQSSFIPIMIVVIILCLIQVIITRKILQ